MKLFAAVAVLLALLSPSIPALAGKVYFDNSNEKWSTVGCYCWTDGSSDQNAGWPGVAMTRVGTSDIWEYDIPNGQKYVIFNDNKKDTNTQTGNLNYAEDHVYNKEGDTGMTYAQWLMANDPGNQPEYTIWFDNKNSRSNVYIKVNGNSSLGGKMESNLNGRMHSITFQAPSNSTCQFYTLSGGSEQDVVGPWTMVNNHVYTESGDKGDYASYEMTNDVEAEYWTVPAQPAQNQAVTLYFNRAYKSDSKLKTTNDIYIWTGLTKQGDNSTWYGAPGNWGSPGDKYKLKQSADNPDIFYLEFTPTLQDWFGQSEDDRFVNLAVIFRDASGNTKQHEADQMIPLRQLPSPGAGMGAYVSHRTENGHVEVTTAKGKILITPMDREIVKIFTLKSDASKTEERASISVPARGHAKYALTAPDFSVTDGTDDDIVISIDGGTKVHLYKEDSHMSFHDANDAQYLCENSGLNNKTSGGAEISFMGANDAGFYGGGYNGNYINQNGKSMVMNNTQTGGWSQGTNPPHNICIPFFVSTNGDGVYVDEHYKGATLYPQARGTTYSSGSEDPIAYYFIGGGEQNEAGRGSMEKVMQNYTRLTGLQELPPYWALGYITSKYSFASRTEAEQTISKTKNINIPIDGIALDIHWQGGVSKMGKIDWDTDAYKNPKEMVSNFKKQNVNTILITEPYFTSNCGNYDYLKNNGMFSDDHVEDMDWLNSANVGLLDVTKQSAIDWFKDLYKQRVDDGIASWWLDLGEPEKHDGGTKYEKGNFNQIHNEYGNRWTELVYDALKEKQPEERFMLMPRAGTSGMQRFNTFPWTGDIRRSWEGLKAQVPVLISGAMSGVSYLGSDIGGFSTNGNYTDANLYLRWVQLGVFYPAMRTHSADHPEVWQDVYSSVRDNIRDAINLRYAYLPYTYSQSYAYTRFGTPIARPANFNDSDPSALSDCISAYYWGPDLFVAPVLENSTSKSITLPEGEWLDMTDFKTVYPGLRQFNYSAPLSTLPRFMRRGSFVTRYRQDTFTSTAEIDRSKITVDYFPINTAEGYTSTWYDDDHRTVDPISTGEYVTTDFIGSGTDAGILMLVLRSGQGWSGMSRSQDILLQIHCPDDMSAVNLHKINLQMESVPQRAAAGPQRIGALTTTDVTTRRNSLSDLKDDTSGSNAYAVDGQHLYLRLPNVDPLASFAVRIGDEGNVPVGVTDIEAATEMTLAYAAGYFTYQAPSEISGLALSVYSATGAEAARLTGLNASGHAEQAALSLPAGVYIARLSGRDSSGAEHAQTIKLVAR